MTESTTLLKEKDSTQVNDDDDDDDIGLIINLDDIMR